MRMSRDSLLISCITFYWNSVGDRLGVGNWESELVFWRKKLWTWRWTLVGNLSSMMKTSEHWALIFHDAQRFFTLNWELFFLLTNFRYVFGRSIKFIRIYKIFLVPKGIKNFIHMKFFYRFFTRTCVFLRNLKTSYKQSRRTLSGPLDFE